MHATRCALASPKVSLEVTLPPLNRGSAWDVCWQPRALVKGCNTVACKFSLIGIILISFCIKRCLDIKICIIWGMGRGSRGKDDCLLRASADLI